MGLLEGVLAAALSLPVHKEDVGAEFADAKRDQLTAIAEAVASESKLQRVARPAEWAALMLAVSWHESGLSLRIHRGECRPKECDGGRARGLWQNHKYNEAATYWDRMHGLEHVEVQARVANITLVRGYHTCKAKADDWMTAAVNGFAGVACDKRWPGLETRIALQRRLRGVIERESRKAKAES